MIIGITGGTGCGKTTALQAIAQLGGLVIDCDKVYHNLLQTDKNLLNAIDARFPNTVHADVLDRKLLGTIVFSDEKALRDLNAITHHAVKEAILQILANCPDLVAIDAIELFDSGLGELCDATVAITAPEEDRVRRLIARDNISREYALMRIHAQKSESYFREKSDYILENTGTAAEFLQKCLVFFQKLSIIKENP